MFKSIILFLFLFLLGVSYSSSANENSFMIAICDRCTEYEMESEAIRHKKRNGVTNVQVSNPTDDVVKAFKIISVREPGLIAVDVVSIPANNDVITATHQAKMVFEAMAVSVASNPEAMEEARKIIDFPAWAHIHMQGVPGNIAPSANYVTLTSAYHMNVSAYLSSQIAFDLSGISKTIIALAATYTVVTYDDGSVQIFRARPLSQVQWEPTGGATVDKNGILKQNNTSSSVAGSQSSSFGVATMVSSGIDMCFVQPGYPTHCWTE